MNLILNNRSVRTIIRISLFLFGLVISVHLASDDSVYAAQSRQDFTLQMLGYSSGNVSAVATQGNYAYVVIGTELVIFDITDPLNLNRLGSVALPLGVRSSLVVVDIQVAGNYVYVGVDRSGLHIIDISELRSPVSVGFYQSGSINGFAVANGFAYVAHGSCNIRVQVCSGGLSILNISNPTAPSQAGTFAMPDSTPLGFGQTPAQKVAVVGRYAYLTGSRDALSPSSVYETGLWVIDSGNPSNPVEVGFYDLSSGIFDVEVAGHYAYVTAAGQGFKVIDISNPQNPIEVGAYEQNGGVRSLTIAGGYAYVSSDGLKIIDLSDPSNPRSAGSYNQSGHVAVSGDLAFIAAGVDGLAIIDVANPTVPAAIDIFDPPGEGVALAVQGDYGYLLDGDKLRVLNLTGDANPVEQSRYTLPAGGMHLTVSDDYAYIAAGEAALRIIDVSNPTRPDEVGFLDTVTAVVDIDVQDQFAYLAAQESGLRVVDISNPTSPIVVGSYLLLQTHQQAVDVVMRGDYAYVNTRDSLVIIDVSNTSKPVKAGEVNIEQGGALDIEVVGQYAYLSSRNILPLGLFTSITINRLHIIDVSDPTTPLPVGTYRRDEGAPPYGIAAVDDYAYLALGEVGLCVLDVANAANPIEIGCHLPPSSARAIAIANHRIYATGDGGFYILAATSSLSGRVSQVNGSPVSGVTITTDGGMTSTDQDGQYSLKNLSIGSYAVAPTLSDFVFTPPDRMVNVPRHFKGQNFIMLPKPVSASLTPGVTTTITVIDTQNLSTELTFPADAVSEPTKIVLSPTVAPGQPGKAFASHAFELSVTQPNGASVDLSFATPVQATIDYSELDVGVIIDKAQLTFERWTMNGWKDTAELCPMESKTVVPPDPSVNRYSGLICQAGRFALFAPTLQAYYPLFSD